MVRHWRGQLYENLGLPLDALAIYQDVLRLTPDYPATLPRLAWVNTHLMNPLTEEGVPPE